MKLSTFALLYSISSTALACPISNSSPSSSSPISSSPIVEQQKDDPVGLIISLDDSPDGIKDSNDKIRRGLQDFLELFKNRQREKTDRPNMAVQSREEEHDDVSYLPHVDSMKLLKEEVRVDTLPHVSKENF
jgi:hypothetical protein